MNQQAMLRKVMKMKQEMEQTQKEINETEYTATSGGGIVSVTALGTKQIVKIEVKEDFECEGKEDLEILLDSIVAASQQVIKDIDKDTEQKLSKYTALLGGFGF